MTNAIATLANQTVNAIENASAEKKATAAKKATRKPATKKAAQPKTAKPVTRTFKYQIVTGRPGSGYNLFAFTQAWLEMAGLDKGKAISRKDAETAAGYTAIAYHVKTGRMVEKDGKISLTAGGKDHFAKRTENVEREFIDAWKTLLKTGKAQAQLNIKQNHIRAID